MAMGGLDRPPLPAPDVSSQMGQGGPPGQPPPRPTGPGDLARPPMGGPNPHGFILAQVDAVKKVLEQMAQTEPTFAPFAQKAISILDTGVSAVSTAPVPKGPQDLSPGAAPPSGGLGGGMPALA